MYCAETSVSEAVGADAHSDGSCSVGSSSVRSTTRRPVLQENEDIRLSKVFSYCSLEAGVPLVVERIRPKIVRRGVR